MYWAQVTLAILFFLKLTLTMALQGKKLNTTCDGWNLFLLLLDTVIIFFAGAFSQILPVFQQ